LSELRQRLGEVDEWYVDYVRTLDERDLQKALHVKFTDGAKFDAGGKMANTEEIGIDRLPREAQRSLRFSVRRAIRAGIETEGSCPEVCDEERAAGEGDVLHEHHLLDLGHHWVGGRPELVHHEGDGQY
jgi:hypothetical protein